MNPILEHVIKVFLYSFFGILIPELLALLNGLPLDFAPAAIIPALCAALSAGLAAVWSCVSRILARDIEDDEVCDSHIEDCLEFDD